MRSSARHKNILHSLLALLGIMFLTTLFGKWGIDHLITTVKSTYYLRKKYEISYRGVLLISQTIMSISFFIVTPLLYSYFIEKKRIGQFFVGEKRYVRFMALTIILTLGMMETSKYFAYWNMHLKLPDFLQAFELWAQQKEAALKMTMDVLMAFDDIPNLCLTILVMGVVPALGEELLFRGVLQSLFFRGTANRHLAILMSAFLFSAIHMQLYGFLPRLLFGMLLGYLYTWTRNLWYPIVAHFFNNGMALIVYFVHRQDAALLEQYDLPNIHLLMGAVLVVAVLVGYIQQKTSYLHRSSKYDNDL